MAEDVVERALAPVAPAGRARRERLGRLRSRSAPYVLVAPFFLLFGTFGLFPLAATAWTSLFRVELTDPGAREWVGAHNYARLLTDDFFWNALANTVVIGVLATSRWFRWEPAGER